MAPASRHQKKWDEFFTAAEFDKPVDHMQIFINHLREVWGTTFIYVTGRPERNRSITDQWLEHYNFPRGRLFMRPDGDHRPDTVIKLEILDKHLREIIQDEMAIAFDDRNSVVKMWRDNGIPCLQVAEGDF